ncbi:MAG: hypothetical protein CM15mP32_1020 [Flavobacteriaceae bacterium]|nr:MAG: hypothetical protein CM15mP32_1020 [Flavobacteriaceae bacterium]
MIKRLAQKQQSYGYDAEFVAKNQSRGIGCYQNTSLRNYCQSRCLLSQKCRFWFKRDLRVLDNPALQAAVLTLHLPFWYIISNLY